MGQWCSSSVGNLPPTDCCRPWDNTVGILHRSISVSFLSTTFADEIIAAGFSEETPIKVLEPSVIRPKGQDLICPRDGRLGTAYVDAIHGPANVGMATHMLSYTWGYSMLGDVIPSLLQYCEDVGLDPTLVYPWMCCLCVNQHRVKERERQGHSVPFAEFQATFLDRVETIGHLLALMSPWECPVYLTRVWCVGEMYTALKAGSTITVLMPPGQRLSFIRAMQAPSQTPSNLKVYQALTQVDVEKAEASVAEDSRRILQMIRGPEGPGVKKFNMDVQSFLKRWYVDTLEEQSRKLLSDPKWSSPERADFCANTGMMLYDNGHYSRAIELMKDAMIILAPIGEPDTPSGARIMAEIAVLEMKQGNFKSSVGAFERSKELYLQTGTFDSEAGAMLCDNRGSLLRKMGNLDGAMEALLQGYTLRKDLNILDTFSGARLIGNIGYVNELQGEWDTARRMYEDAMAIHMQKDTLKTPSGALLLTSIGSLKERGGDLEDACKMYENAKEIRLQTGTLKTPAAALLLADIGSLKARIGDLDSAWESYTLAREVRTETGVLDTPDGKKLLDAMAGLEKTHGITLLTSRGPQKKGDA